MKKTYTRPEIEVTVYSVEDVVTTSIIIPEDSANYSDVKTISYTDIFKG